MINVASEFIIVALNKFQTGTHQTRIAILNFIYISPEALNTQI